MHWPLSKDQHSIHKRFIFITIENEKNIIECDVEQNGGKKDNNKRESNNGSSHHLLLHFHFCHSN